MSRIYIYTNCLCELLLHNIQLKIIENKYSCSTLQVITRHLEGKFPIRGLGAIFSGEIFKWE